MRQGAFNLQERGFNLSRIDVHASDNHHVITAATDALDPAQRATVTSTFFGKWVWNEVGIARLAIARLCPKSSDPWPLSQTSGSFRPKLGEFDKVQDKVSRFRPLGTGPG